MIDDEIQRRADNRATAEVARADARKVADAARVDALIQRDKAERVREIDRKAAILDLENGKSVSIGDAVIEPTPEWLEKGDVRWFTPRLEDGTVRTVKAARRVQTPIVMRMNVAGKLSDEHLLACLWYRDRFEVSGLEGRVKSSNFSLAGAGGGGGGGDGQAPMALHQREAEARQEFRAARAAIASVLLKMFESVVLGDLPLRRAERYVRCRNGNIHQRFRAACGDLLAHCDAVGLDLSAAVRSDGD